MITKLEEYLNKVGTNKMAAVVFIIKEGDILS